ncbi:MAG: methyltransferase [Candidatus Heimdallarchaeota archaeon]|nr:methyltransferase [Candidatus Heimdallarchaeota archaeon]
MLIDSFEAEKILEAYHQGKESIVAFFDLRFTQHKVVFKHNKIIIGDFSYDPKTIQKIAKNPSVFLIDKKPKKIAFFDERYYKLEPIENTAPTIEIDGIRMHRTKHVTPLEDARRKIFAVNVAANEKVLDVCTGLGYTAIESLRMKASVTTIEKDPNVIEIAKYNPYSADLFTGIESNKIELILEDACVAVKQMADETFDVILHDPPRFALAGELYSQEIYVDLFRILKEEGRMLHYVGKPGSKYRGKDFISGIQRRLNEVGFKTKRTDDNESVLAYK